LKYFGDKLSVNKEFRTIHQDSILLKNQLEELWLEKMDDANDKINFFFKIDKSVKLGVEVYPEYFNL
jgi:hypothetical protein